VLVAACAACAAPTAGTRSAAAPIAPSDQLYVSIGDSYAAGYQPSGPAAGATTTNGFAYQLADRSAAKGTGMRLVNFGCSGVTSTGLLNDRGCLRDALAPGAPNYAGVPQAEAAGAFLRAHRGQVVLVTVVVGGNDVKPCLLTAQGRVRPDTVSCVAGAVATLRSNLARLLGGVRAAVGPNVRVVGLTYPDMFLGAWVSGGPDGHEIATRSVSMFRDALNPTLRAEYAKAGASFVDVTAASGAYGSMADSTAVPPYGPVPEPVAQACALTFYCEYGDPHPRTEGYTLIADLVQRTLPAS
jgi:lysophospholipase L1-like esterase